MALVVDAIDQREFPTLVEGDLAQSLGPEEAHRVTYAEGMCMGQHSFGGGGPREPEKK